MALVFLWISEQLKYFPAQHVPCVIQRLALCTQSLWLPSAREPSLVLPTCVPVHWCGFGMFLFTSSSFACLTAGWVNVTDHHQANEQQTASSTSVELRWSKWSVWSSLESTSQRSCDRRPVSNTDQKTAAKQRYSSSSVRKQRSCFTFWVLREEEQRPDVKHPITAQEQRVITQPVSPVHNNRTRGVSARWEESAGILRDNRSPSRSSLTALLSASRQDRWAAPLLRPLNGNCLFLMTWLFIH